MRIMTKNILKKTAIFLLNVTKPNLEIYAENEKEEEKILP